MTWAGGMLRLLRYVGPADIARDARGAPRGLAVRSGGELRSALAGIGGRTQRELWLTYVVDAEGVLRVADRGSEHVACAGGGPVIAAGELVIEGERVVRASNLSTGYCPEPGDCARALVSRLKSAGIGAPETFDRFELRLCRSCGAREVIKDSHFECSTCGAPLPERWNFERAAHLRGWIEGPRRWTVDVIVEPGSRDQDRAVARLSAHESFLALADGAGGGAHGARAAEAVVEHTARADSMSAILELDRRLELIGGQSTAILARLAIGETLRVEGASVGDSQAWARVGDTWVELTERQRRKPLLGSGRAEPIAFAREGVDALVMHSDGLRHITIERMAALVASDAEHAGWAIVDAARTAKGALDDDVALVIVR